ncbi:outer membrane beta-barrel protein [Tunicatimonas pelagia]|uniref:outer membrane beta-barrel protein n=1 Tax=Tunicatimonas pelagia TaxID=931531 RepID=UPI002665FE18|nr:outer membrane beta-barrel protein [Tunicatimonas pelagia]WKN44779.1 outer membrane beta-barrel protein [Tunicatimonas pelagia]
MKKLLILSVLAFSVTFALAQEESQQETLVNGFQVTSVGGYGGPSFRTSSIGGDFALLFGGYGGVFINKKWMFGGAGYGMVTQLDVPPAAANGNRGRHYDMGYGGFLTEYILNSDRMLHLTAQMLIGGGGISHDIEGDDLEDTESNFFVLEPGVGVELNITDFFRVNGGFTYRLVSGSNTAGITDGDLSSMAFFLNLKFGSFN